MCGLSLSSWICWLPLFPFVCTDAGDTQLYGIYVLITALMKRPTEKDRLRERGFHTKTVAHVELYYTISQFIVVLVSPAITSGNRAAS